MKVEVYLSELEAIRKENVESREKIRELNKKIKDLDGTVIKIEASKLAEDILRKMIVKTFNDLGFTADWFSVDTPYQKDWWELGNVEVVLGANINNAIKRAYMKIGIVTK